MSVILSPSCFPVPGSGKAFSCLLNSPTWKFRKTNSPKAAISKTHLKCLPASSSNFHPPALSSSEWPIGSRTMVAHLGTVQHSTTVPNTLHGSLTCS